MTVNQSQVVKIDKDVPFELAALVGCGVPTGWGSATHIADVKPGDSVAIIGVGGVGMSALQGAVASGARYVFAIDPVPWKREQAMKFGATHTYASIEEAIVPIMEVTWGRMCQETIITGGEMKGDLVDPALTLTAKGGKCVVTAMGFMSDMDVKLNSFLFSMLQKDLKGNIFGGCNARVDIPQLLDLYKSGQLNLDGMITNRMKIDEINDAFDIMKKGEAIRTVITF
jgi:S-(hydroxymethyl)glutathione dehydrogenase/alcohol dehydrogenase